MKPEILSSLDPNPESTARITTPHAPVFNNDKLTLGLF